MQQLRGAGQVEILEDARVEVKNAKNVRRLTESSSSGSRSGSGSHIEMHVRSLISGIRADTIVLLLFLVLAVFLYFL